MNVPTNRPTVPQSVVDNLTGGELAKLHLVVDTLGTTKVSEFQPDNPSLSIVEEADAALAEDRRAEEASRSWRYLDLTSVLAGTISIEPPSLLRRRDGLGLFYAGCRNELHGDGEQGKGWVACIAAAEVLLAGGVVAYFDWEDSVEAIIERLRALGVPDANIGRGLRYVSPSQPLGPATEVDARLTLRGATLVIVDAVNEAMTAEGLDPNSNGDVARWYAGLPHLATEAGATGIYIDHVAKDPERRLKAIGGVHKRNAIDGASYSVEADPPFGRGSVGKIVLKLSKDRRGFLRGTAPGLATPTIAEITLDATDPEAIAYDVRPDPSSGSDHFRPTTLMGRVSTFLDGRTESATLNEIEAAIGSSHKYARLAIDALIREGHIEVTRGPNRSQLHTLTTPFTEADALQVGTVGTSGFRWGHDHRESGGDGGSTPYRGNTTGPPPEDHPDEPGGDTDV